MHNIPSLGLAEGGLRAEHVSGAENGAERAKTRVERSGAVSGSQKNRRSGAEHEREDRGAGTELGAD